MSNEDRLRDIEAQWATLRDVTLPILRRQVREADDKAQDAIWRFPKNVKASVPQGHVHPFDAGGGLIHFDIVVDASFGHPDGTAVVLYSGQTVLLYNDIEAAVAYANASRQTVGQNTNFWINTGDYTITASMTVNPPNTGNYAFFGSGRNSVIIRPGSSLSSGSMITHSPMTSGKVYYNNLTFCGRTSAGSNKNIALVSGGTAPFLFISDCGFRDGSGTGFDPGTGIAGSYLINCDFNSCTGDGIGQSPNAPNEAATGVRAVNCSFVSCGTGVRIRGALSDGLFYFSNCLFYSSSTRDVYYLKATNYPAIFSQCEFNAEVTIDADTAGTLAGNGLIFTNCNFTVSSAAYGIAFIAAAVSTGSASALKGFLVTGSLFWGSGTAIGIDGGKVTGGYSAPTGNPTDGMISNNTFVGFTSGSEIKNWSTNGALSFHNISDGGVLADTGAPYGHAAAGTAASNAESYVVIAASANLSAERVLTAGSNISVTDAGANSTVTIAATGLAVTSEPFVTLGNTSGLSAERALTAGANVLLTDGGANSTATIAAGTQNWAWSGVLSPASIGANQTDYNPANLATATVLRLTSSAGYSIFSLAGGADGRVLVLHNIGSNLIILKNDDSATGTASMRFALPGDEYINANECCTIQYDNTTARWRMIGRTPIVAQPTRGDLIVGSSATAWAKKAIGASGTILRSDGNDPGWTVVYSEHNYVDVPDVAIGTAIATGSQQGVVHHSGSQAEVATKFYVDCETAATTAFTCSVDYGSTDVLDTPPTWTQIATLAVGTNKSASTTSMTNAAIPANRLIRFNVDTVTGTAPQNATFTLRVKRLLTT